MDDAELRDAAVQESSDDRSSDGDVADLDGVRLGGRVRAMRTARRLTINDLAAKAGVSAGIISQIERGRSNPSMNTLKSIREALGVSLWALLDPGLLEEAGDAKFVRRASTRPRLEVGTGRIRKELLSLRPDGDLRLMTIAMPPGSSTDEMLIGAGEKAGLVLRGEVELTVASRTATLYQGDSFQFASNQTHCIANRTDSEAELIWVMSMVTAAF